MSAAAGCRQPRRATPWPGRLFLWGGRGLYLGPVFDTGVHAHHAVQVSIALEGRFRLRTGARGRWRECEAAVVPSDQLHQADGRGAALALLYLDPESTEARAIAWRRGLAIEGAEIAAAQERLRRCWRESEGNEETLRACDDVVTLLTPIAAMQPQLDRRITGVLNLLRADADQRPTLASLAATVGLSTSRLIHLFRDEVGLPVRRYLLWLRLADALQRMVDAASLTEAAHAAGFADSAHLSRTFRRMLGLSPSTLFRHSQFVQAESFRTR